MSANTPLTSCQVLSSDCHCFKPAIVFGAIARSGQYFHLLLLGSPPQPILLVTYIGIVWTQSLQPQFCLPHISCLAPKIKAKNPIISYSFESCSITSINIAIVQYTKLATINQEQDQVPQKKKNRARPTSSFCSFVSLNVFSYRHTSWFPPSILLQLGLLKNGFCNSS